MLKQCRPSEPLGPLFGPAPVDLLKVRQRVRDLEQLMGCLQRLEHSALFARPVQKRFVLVEVLASTLNLKLIGASAGADLA